jgi:hypothetical protein
VANAPLSLLVDTANRDDVTVLINLPEPSQLLGIAAGVAMLLWLRWRSESRVSKEVT